MSDNISQEEDEYIPTNPWPLRWARQVVMQLVT